MLGTLHAYAVAGVDPALHGHRPGGRRAQGPEKAGWKLDEMEHIELNEAFAAQSLAVMRELGLDPAKTNPHGRRHRAGPSAGMSGARLVGTLLHAMKRDGTTSGLATLCVGGGMGAAALFLRGADRGMRPEDDHEHQDPAPRRRLPHHDTPDPRGLHARGLRRGDPAARTDLRDFIDQRSRSR